MIKDITVGQFFPGESIVHGIDPRVNFAITFISIIFVFLANTAASIALITLFVVTVVLLTKIPFKLYFKGLKPIFIIVIITSLLNIFYIKTGNVLFSWEFITITDQGLMRSALIAVRIAVMILLSCVLTYTTSPTALTDALERLMKPLKTIKVPVHEIATMMTIALRFVPTLLEETDKITSAQKARGADLESGSLMQRVRAMVPILIPLFVSAFRRAYDLAMAMECRCYHGGEGRTRMKQLHMSKRDYLTVALCAAIYCGVILCNLIPPTL